MLLDAEEGEAVGCVVNMAGKLGEREGLASGGVSYGEPVVGMERAQVVEKSNEIMSMWEGMERGGRGEVWRRGRSFVAKPMVLHCCLTVHGWCGLGPLPRWYPPPQTARLDFGGEPPGRAKRFLYESG